MKAGGRHPKAAESFTANAPRIQGPMCANKKPSAAQSRRRVE